MHSPQVTCKEQPTDESLPGDCFGIVDSTTSQPRRPLITLLPNAGWPLALAFTWAWTWNHLANEWSTNSQYEYGFAVPFLAIYIGVTRWKGVMSPSTGLGSWVLVGIAWLSFALGELLRCNDPIWRFTGGLLTFGSLLLTAAWMFQAGGWTFLRREAFTLGFACLGLPWPLPIELGLTQWLLRLVTGISISIASTFGIAALQHGNVIELANGYVGMAGACSGVESLQSSFMVSLFLGEFFKLPPWGRVRLVLTGWLIAFSSNLLRVLALIFVVHKQGQPALGEWHDLVGSISTASTFLLIFAAAALLANSITPFKFPASSSMGHIGGRTGWGVLALFLLIPLLVQGWCRVLAQTANAEQRSTPLWTLNLGTLPEGWSAESRQLPPEQRASLRYSSCDYVLLRTPEGWSAKLVHLFWNPDMRMPGTAFYHTPALCLSAQGWTQAAPPESVELSLNEKRTPCVRYTLEQDETFQSVFQCLSCGGKTEPFFVHSANRTRRLSLLWNDPGKKVNEELLLYMPSLGSPETQNAEAEKLLNTILRASLN